MNRKRLLEIVMEIAIAVSLVVILILDAWYVPEGFWPQWISFNVVGMAAFTFGFPLKWYRRYWERPFFWGAFLALLAAHLVFFTMFFRTLGTLWLGVLSPIEWVVICPALEAAGNDSIAGDSNETPPSGDDEMRAP